MTAPATSPVDRAWLREIVRNACVSATSLKPGEVEPLVDAAVFAICGGPIAALAQDLDAVRAELDAVDRAFEGLEETDRARRIGQWIATAASECTARQKAERERDTARADADRKAAEIERLRVVSARTERAEARAAISENAEATWRMKARETEGALDAALERCRTQEAALEPFAAYRKADPGRDFGHGEIGEYYHEGRRISIRTQDLDAAVEALARPAAPQGSADDAG